MLRILIIALLSATLLSGCGNSVKNISGDKNPNEKLSAKELYINDDIKIVDIIGLNKSATLAMLGDEYEIINEVGSELMLPGYYYPKYDITIIFIDDSMSLIECGKETNVNGVHFGMTIAEIQDILGEGEIDDFGGHGYEQYQYALVYRYEEIALRFYLWEGDDHTQDFIIQK